MPDAVLTLNAGSSSIKFALFETSRDRICVLRGQIEGIGTEPHFRVADTSGAALIDRRWTDHESQTRATLLATMLDWIDQHLGDDRLIAVGHRVVHGGPDHDRPVLVTEDLIVELERLIPLAPLHQPHNIAPIRAIADMRKGLPQVVCFDTAFHHDMPVLAQRMALPRAYVAKGLRRYGFHGISYEYIARELRETEPALAAGRVIVAHLGNGASLCALRGGRSMDTTMGFTALDGLVMGTRCGALDPGVILYLQQTEAIDAAGIERMLYRQSGLLGVSAISSDMRVLMASPEPAAREAIELFVFRLVREAGAMAGSLGGLDGLVFTAGIGENTPEIRQAVCEKLAWLGVVLDPHANASDAARISAPDSRVAVLVLRTDEEAMLARHATDIVCAPRSYGS